MAGDQLKAASDLGVPAIGVGLLYQQGYFRQVIDGDGSQRAVYPYNDPSQLPIRPLRNSEGEWLRVRVQLPGYAVWLRTWEVRVGKVRLFLLDSNDPANPPVYRGVTSELYGGGTELRLQQEIVLGIIGYRMLHVLGIHPEVCHLNEGHAGFAVWERARIFMEETGVPFDVALLATRAGNVFTTHTPVDAGIDRFPPDLVGPYLTYYAHQVLHVDIHDLLAMGKANPDDPAEPFNMAYLGIHGCGAVNGVSQLHAEVSRKMFSNLFPRWPVAEVPIGCVTNGVHVPSWDSTEADALWAGACGSDRWRDNLENLEQLVRSVSDQDLWKMRCTNRERLVDEVGIRDRRQANSVGRAVEQNATGPHIFDPNILILGFARRFATYKRPNLLLCDPERLARILTNPSHPVQLAVAGKAHPQDREGQAMIQQWVLFARRKDVRGHVVFLSDYDMSLAEQLVQGVDVWINTPRRPWEACGTSGMKVLVNGGLNLSSLDGWWAEAYDPSVGWKVGDHQVYGNEADQDSAEAEQLYSVLENEVIPLFYRRDPSGVPAEWTRMMRESMARLSDDLWNYFDSSKLLCGICAEHSHRLLVAVGHRQSYPSIVYAVDLEAKSVMDITGDLHLLTTGTAVAQAAREEARRCPGVLDDKHVGSWGPSDTLMKGTLFQHAEVYVPIDERQEKLAQKVLSSQPDPAAILGYRTNDRYNAVKVLAFFRSPQNTKILKTQLNDPEIDHEPAGILVYPIRELAYGILRQWGVDVPQPTRLKVQEPWDGKMPRNE